VSRIRFHLDEDCQTRALAKALQQHGIDTKTTHELGLSGISEDRQLEAAHQAGRVLVTNNICDFVPLHGRWREPRQASLSIAGLAQGQSPVPGGVGQFVEAGLGVASTLHEPASENQHQNAERQ
jgi:hypothetical protein